MIVVVWKKTEKARTHHMTVFTKLDSPDHINTTKSRNPVIPISAPFIEMGIGKSFINKWKDRYKIKKISYWPPETK